MSINHHEANGALAALPSVNQALSTDGGHIAVLSASSLCVGPIRGRSMCGRPYMASLCGWPEDSDVWPARQPGSVEQSSHHKHVWCIVFV